MTAAVVVAEFVAVAAVVVDWQRKLKFLRIFDPLQYTVLETAANTAEQQSDYPMRTSRERLRNLKL